MTERIKREWITAKLETIRDMIGVDLEKKTKLLKNLATTNKIMQNRKNTKED